VARPGIDAVRVVIEVYGCFAVNSQMNKKAEFKLNSLLVILFTKENRIRFVGIEG